MLKKASDNVKVRKVDEMKGVVGMISESKLLEPSEKGILGPKMKYLLLKMEQSATIQQIYLSNHFIPKEIGVTVEKLLEMGYT